MRRTCGGTVADLTKRGRRSPFRINVSLLRLVPCYPALAPVARVDDISLAPIVTKWSMLQGM